MMQKITEQWTDVDESDPWAEGGAGVMEESLYFDELRSYEEKLYLDDPLDVKYFPKSNVPNTNIENTLEFNEGDARRIDAEKRIQYLYNWNSDKVLKDPIQPIIVEFRKLIESDNKLHMLFNAMLRYAGEDESYHRNPMGEIRKPDYKYLLLLFNAMLTRAPALHAEKNVFIPLRVVLRWSLSNAAGAAAFRDDRVNELVGRIQKQWMLFLASPASSYVLAHSPDGWFGREAAVLLKNFNKTYICNPSAPHHGFKSWDDFFTRKFRPEARPIEAPNDDRVIINACEAKQYRLRFEVKATDDFWMAEQPYSIWHMLAHDELAENLFGGTVYQAMLSYLKYQRWHSPVDGTILKAYVQPGIQLTQVPTVTMDSVAVEQSTSYYTAVATRAIIFIMARNPDIGLMCFMAVNGAETSSCEITVRAGQQVRKGEELGMFHHQKSTYCMIFGPKTQLDWKNIQRVTTMSGTDIGKEGPRAKLPFTHVNRELARVR